MNTIKAYIAFDQHENIDNKLLIDTMMQVVNLFSRSGIMVEFCNATLRDVDNLSPNAMFVCACETPSVASLSEEERFYNMQEPSCELCIFFEKSEGFPTELYSDMFNKRYAQPVVYSFQTSKVYSIKSLIEDYANNIIGAEICEK